MYPLRADAREALCGEAEPAAWQLGEKSEPMAAPALRSLAEFPGEIPDFRKARGQRYPLSCYLAIAIAARLAGYRGVTAMGEFAALLDPDQLRAVGAFWSPSRKRYTAPAISTFPLHLDVVASRHVGPRPARLDRATLGRRDARGDGRQRGPRRVEGAHRRQAPNAGGCGGARQRSGARTGSGRRYDQRASRQCGNWPRSSTSATGP